MKIGITLSGGGARGAAHTGALQALNENDIFPQAVSGSSAGALIGALYCCGYAPKEILQLSTNHSFLKIFRLGFINKGLTELTYLEEFLNVNLKVKTFENLPVSLKVGVTNINTGAFEIIDSGNIVDAVVASCSIPLLFRPKKIGKDIYIDGGVTNNLPIECLEADVDKILGISVCPHKYDSRVDGMKDIAERVFHLAVWNNMESRMAKCDFAIEIEGAFPFGMFDLQQSQELFKVGYDALKQDIQRVKRIFEI
ncbi:patatin-like phospholipase family protein [Croceitalea sp. MTPC5]|uniref:patatin-like phospholipase family protein n=1 Tax=Croceitalea sp. MTPC5 TaxID=3056565 RepID=UPI002B368716|nr:patatin-like phospholipase family protein [Croceitalea sp. MTPC5]